MAGAAATLLGSAGGSPAQEVKASDLSVTGPLGDVWLGPSDAKVNVIEYASLTCSHCAAFHRQTWPVFRSAYVDTGKVRFTLREFPLDPLATAGFMLARADGGRRYYEVVDKLFTTPWAFGPRPLDALVATMAELGVGKAEVEAVLRDQGALDAVNAVKRRAMQMLGVDSTPTFFVGTTRIKGAASASDMDAALKPLLG